MQLSSKWINAVAGSVIVIMTMIVYIPAMQGGFIWDDDSFLTNNPLIKASDGLYRFWFTTDAQDYFPLVSSSLWLEWRLWGMNATGYHVVNVILHTISSILLWLVLRRLKIPGSWLAGLIFAIHPVNVESVAWITERKNTLPMAFYLSSIICYLRFETDHHTRWYFISLGSFLLALLSKTSVVMLPLVLLSCAWWQRNKINRNDIFSTLPFLILSLIFGMITIWFQYNHAIGPEVVRSDGLLSRLIGAGWAVWFYLYKAIIPYKLTFVYPRWDIDTSLILSYLPLLGLISLFVIFWKYRNSWGRPFLAGLGYFVLTLIPVLGFLDIYFMKYSLVADHWQYTSIIGVIALITGGGYHFAIHLHTRFQPVVGAFAVVIVALFSTLTWQQGHIYKNEETLWRDTIMKNRSASMSYYNLGVILARKGNLDEAIIHYKETIRLDSTNANAHNNIGNALAERGKLDEAHSHFLEAVRLNPGSHEVHTNLGIVLVKQGMIDKAIEYFSKALTIEPNYAFAHYTMGDALERQEKLVDAAEHFNQVIKIKPNYAAGHYKLSLILSKLGKEDKARSHFSEAIRINQGLTQQTHNSQ